MKRWISLAVATALTGCVSADGGAAPQGARQTAQAEGRCFRASDVTNYNARAPHAVFVLTRRGQVFGLVAEDCFPDSAAAISLPQARRGNPLLCPGDEVEVAVTAWRGQGSPCLARVTDPVVDADVSGFRARSGAG